jgi:Mycobacterium 19 kDa lipoprotein antigen
MANLRPPRQRRAGNPRDESTRQPRDRSRDGVGAPAALRRSPSPNTVLIDLGASALSVIVLAAMLVACSNKSGTPTSGPTPGSASTSATTGSTPGGGAASAEMTVDGHTHRFSGPVNCTTQEGNPSGTPPRGNMEISASDDAASFDLSWSDTTPYLATMSLHLKVDNGEYSMPVYPHPPEVEATKQGKSYTVKGTPPVEAPGNQSAMKALPVEIHVTCP